ncbi:MAG: PilZ domain-containing protein [Planctomycetes bacterium]|nr:PilZ domain-containing protein [Planctomycetota bacterium]
MTSPAADPLDSTTHDVDRLLDRSQETGQPDLYLGKRRWGRWSTGMALEATSDPSGRTAPWAVTMENVSGGGIAFWARKKFDLGERLYIREFIPEAPTDWIPGDVMHCTAGLRGSLVGVKFDEPAPADQDAE